MQRDTRPTEPGTRSPSWIVVGVALIALAACHAPSSDSVPIEVVAQEASQPTLRYLRTENIAEADRPAHYIDVFELNNRTSGALVCPAYTVGGIRCDQEVLIFNGEWQRPYTGYACGFGLGREPSDPHVRVEPGAVVRFFDLSWLRPSRARIEVRRQDTGESFMLATSEFDSSSVAPGEPPPKTIWDGWDELLRQGG